MEPQFTYFSKDQVEGITDFSNALMLIAKENVILDTDYLVVLEAAERGNFLALCEMAEAFSEGKKGVPRNYRLARRYHDVIMTENSKRNSPKLIVETLRNNGTLERNFNNIEAAKKEFIEAIKVMTNELPPEKWDFDIFNSLYQLTFPEPENEANQ